MDCFCAPEGQADNDALPRQTPTAAKLISVTIPRAGFDLRQPLPQQRFQLSQPEDVLGRVYCTSAPGR